MRLNPIAPQAAPVLWGLVCLFGAAVFTQKLFEFPVGSAGWQGGIGGLVLVAVGFIAIEGWWLASQYEVFIDARELTIRSWLQTMFRASGSTIQLDAVRSASLIFERGRKLEIVTPDRRYMYWVGIWNPSTLTKLFEALEARGVPTREDWIPAR